MRDRKVSVSAAEADSRSAISNYRGLVEVLMSTL